MGRGSALRMVGSGVAGADRGDAETRGAGEEGVLAAWVPAVVVPAAPGPTDRVLEVAADDSAAAATSASALIVPVTVRRALRW